jgi:sterol desaturase/sphingolipid hydroxylase (fatty acid hydroxylase superfamily)
MLSSIKWYLLINGFIISMGSLQYLIFSYYKYYVLIIFFITIIKLLLIIFILNYITHNKNFITKGKRTCKFNTIDFLKTSTVETLSFYILINYFTNQVSIIQDLIYFIPRSFIFEIIFDFGHYWTHRLMHTIPILYTIVHKKHHTDYLININTSYNHTLYDYIITNTLPLILAGYIMPSSLYFYNLIFWYKSFVEFAGHTGKSNKSGSFPQCIWLPRFFGIQLHTKDHNIHHISPNYNFSKRFSLWDKIFGTVKY